MTTDPDGWHVVHVHRAAAPKPAIGASCNGCGICCLAEPCPVGILLSRRRTGPCAAVRWIDVESRYRCGAVIEPAAVLPPPLRWIAPLFARLARRWISAGTGCDSSVQAQSPACPARDDAADAEPIPRALERRNLRCRNHG